MENGTVQLVESYLNAKEEPNNKLVIIIYPFIMSDNFLIMIFFYVLSNYILYQFFEGIKSIIELSQIIQLIKRYNRVT